MGDNKTRRSARGTFSKGAGVPLVLVASGEVWRAAGQGVFGVGEGPAYEPWKNWRTNEGEVPIELVRAAILAATRKIPSRGWFAWTTLARSPLCRTYRPKCSLNRSCTRTKRRYTTS